MHIKLSEINWPDMQIRWKYIQTFATTVDSGVESE